MAFSYSLKTLTSLLPKAQQIGETQQAISGIASLDLAQPGELSFLGNTKYKKCVPGSKASVILMPQDTDLAPGPDQVFLLVESPSLALAQLCRFWEKELFALPQPGIHPTAWIDPCACVDPTAYVGPLCVVGAYAHVGAHSRLDGQCWLGAHTYVGAHTRLHPGVRLLDRCKLGDSVIVHAGAVIGSDGYGYEFSAGRHEKLPQIGDVVVEDWVEIGANTTLDRGRFGSTRIAEGTKIDNLVQIAHNVILGKHCLVVSQVGISGSTHIEDYVIIGGQAGIAGHLRVGSNARIGAQSGLNHDLPPHSFVRGTPVLNYMESMRIEVLKKRLPQLFKRVEVLEAQRISTPSAL